MCKTNKQELKTLTSYYVGAMTRDRREFKKIFCCHTFKTKMIRFEVSVCIRSLIGNVISAYNLVL